MEAAAEVGTQKSSIAFVHRFPSFVPLEVLRSGTGIRRSLNVV